MSKMKLVLGLIATAIISSIVTVLAIGYALGFSLDSATDMIRFFGVKRIIETRYVNEVSSTKLVDGAIKGMIEALGDPHSIYLKPDMYKSLQEHTSGTFGGIGVTMGFKDNKVTIISVLPETPGEKAGLVAGDEILAVDNTSVKEFQPEEVALHIRGDVGTNVTLTVLHDGDTKDITLTRDTITVRSVAGEMLSDNIGYIRIASFGENTGKEFREEYDKLKNDGMEKMIIDLRQNPGGLINSCVDIAKMLVPKGNIVSVIQRDGTKEEYTSDLENVPYPLVVLIDGNSASASEILAGALKDTHAATLVGTKSYGKGSVQVVLPLFHDDGMKLTIAKYYTPSGISIDGTGIEPDVAVDLPKNAASDVQLEKAKEILLNK